MGGMGSVRGGPSEEENRAEVLMDFRTSLLIPWHLMRLWTPHAGCPHLAMVILEVPW